MPAERNKFELNSSQTDRQRVNTTFGLNRLRLEIQSGQENGPFLLYVASFMQLPFTPMQEDEREIISKRFYHLYGEEGLAELINLVIQVEKAQTS